MFELMNSLFATFFLFRRCTFTITTKTEVASVLSALIILILAGGKFAQLVPNPFCYRNLFQRQTHPNFDLLFLATDDEPFS